MFLLCWAGFCVALKAACSAQSAQRRQKLFVHIKPASACKDVGPSERWMEGKYYVEVYSEGPSFLGPHLALSRDLSDEKSSRFLEKHVNLLSGKGAAAFGSNYPDQEAIGNCLHFVAQGPLALVHKQAFQPNVDFPLDLCVQAREEQREGPVVTYPRHPKQVRHRTVFQVKELTQRSPAVKTWVFVTRSSFRL